MASLNRVLDDMMALLTETGMDIERSYWTSLYLLHGAIGMAHAPPGTDASGIGLLLSAVAHMPFSRRSGVGVLHQSSNL